MNKIDTFLWTDNVYFYDTLNKKKYQKIPENSENKCAVTEKLLEPPTTLQLTLIPTWSCNLRCPHCFVLKKLNKVLKPEETKINSLQRFISWHRNKYECDKLVGLVIGGEPLLYPDICLEYIELIKSFQGFCTLTTNMSIPINEKIIRIYELLDQSQVSIDGPEDVHNKTRFFNLNMVDQPTTNPNIFKQIIENLKVLSEKNLNRKIHVSVSIRKDLEQTKAISEIKLILKALGIKNITIGHIAESSHFNKTKQKKITSMREMAKPCCSFRYMRHFVVQGNDIYADYFDRSKKSYLGSLDDDFENLPMKYENYIKEDMPILKDESCLSCTALPICWGQCVGHTIFDNFKPSEFCDQQYMIDKMTKLLKSPEYIENFEK
jgi:radical SAM protein with 4Fe4S-binding SPASM domain